jgi:hypothetical protein
MTEQPTRSLAVAALIPPVVWLAQLSAASALVPCTHGNRLVLLIVQLASLGVAAAPGLMAWPLWRGQAGRSLAEDVAGMEDGRFLALMAVVSSALFALVILAHGLPTLLIGPCE